MRWLWQLRRNVREELARSGEALEVTNREVIQPLAEKRQQIRAAPRRPPDSPDLFSDAIRKVMKGQA